MATKERSPGERALDDLSNDEISSFASALRGELVLPGDGGYDDARKLWNGMIDRYPAAVARCTGTADVVAAVNFARVTGLPLAVRGGGHNVSGSAVADGGVVIDLAPMNGVFVDPEARTARVQGGAVLGDVDRETQLHGLATPLGVVSQTGVGGLTLNGGVGHLRREHGLACDNVRSVEVVTAAGEVVQASESHRPDLFWAVRGGGGNFGVVTAFEYELHPVGPEVFGLFVWYHGDDAVAAMRGFRDWSETAPREASVLPFTAFVPEIEEFPERSWGEPAIAFLGCFAGDPGDAGQVLRPLRTLASPIADLSGPMPYVELQSMLDEDYPDGLRYYWKSVFLDHLSDEVIELAARYGRASPSALSTVDVWHLGGAIADVPPDATAYWHREAPFMLNFEANWEAPEDDDRNVAWVREGIEAARALPGVAGQYANFPGFGDDPSTLTFGGNAERLAEVKAAYDPENLFRFNQNVAPATDTAE